MIPSRFECNSLEDRGDVIKLKRGPHGQSTCGSRTFYYKRENWDYRALNRTCPRNNAPVFEMIRKSSQQPATPPATSGQGDLVT